MAAEVEITARRRGRRVLEAAGWVGGLTLSISAVMAMHSLAAQPFEATIDDPLALPKEITSRGQDPNVPLPPVGATDVPLATASNPAAAVPGTKSGGFGAAKAPTATSVVPKSDNRIVTPAPSVVSPPAVVPPGSAPTTSPPSTKAPATPPSGDAVVDTRPVAVPDTTPPTTAAPRTTAAPQPAEESSTTGSGIAGVSTTIAEIINRSNNGRQNRGSN